MGLLAFFFFYCILLVSSCKVGKKKKIHPDCSFCTCAPVCSCAGVCVCVCVNPVVGSITVLECFSGPFVNDRLPKSQSTFLLLLLRAFLHPLALSLPPSLLHLLDDPSVMTGLTEPACFFSFHPRPSASFVSVWGSDTSFSFIHHFPLSPLFFALDVKAKKKKKTALKARIFLYEPPTPTTTTTTTQTRTLLHLE